MDVSRNAPRVMWNGLSLRETKCAGKGWVLTSKAKKSYCPTKMGVPRTPAVLSAASAIIDPRTKRMYCQRLSNSRPAREGSFGS